MKHAFNLTNKSMCGADFCADTAIGWIQYLRGIDFDFVQPEVNALGGRAKGRPANSI